MNRTINRECEGSFSDPIPSISGGNGEPNQANPLTMNQFDNFEESDVESRM